MGGWVVLVDRLIPAFGDAGIVFDDYRPYRHFTLGFCPLC